MGITIVVGGQYGGEGKGKVAHYFAKEKKINIAVRIGGTNSGHTVVNENNDKIILRQLPTPSILPGSISVLSAGSYIDIDLLMEEIKITGITKQQLLIDENAMVILDEDKIEESRSTLRSDIGSTLSGTGSSVTRRIKRQKTTCLARDFEELKDYICDTKKYLFDELEAKENIIIEGTQGFGLSLLHSPYYPYTTSRDTTASGFLSEVGLSPFDVDDVILTIRTYPIRVEGNSGHLEKEISWDSIGKTPELFSVTHKTRRIAEFNAEIVKKAIISNRPSKIVLNHLDYKIEKDRKATIKQIENSIGQKIDFYGVDNKCLIQL